MKRGFTLVEVLLAMVIAVISLTVIAQGMTSAGRGVTAADREATAVLLAAQKIAELESGELPMSEAYEPFEEDGNYTYEISLPRGGRSDLVQVTVRILWTDTEQQLVKVARLFRVRR